MFPLGTLLDRREYPRSWAVWNSPEGERLLVYDAAFGASETVHLRRVYAFDPSLTLVKRGTPGGLRPGADVLSLVEFRSNDPRLHEEMRGHWHLGAAEREAARGSRPFLLVRGFGRSFQPDNQVAPIDWEGDAFDWSSIKWVDEGYSIDEVRLVHQPAWPGWTR